MLLTINKQQQPYQNKPHTVLGTPLNQCQSSYPHLLINQKVVVKDLQGTLRHAAVTLTYHKYLQKKFHWTATNAEEVNWNALTMAFHYFPKDLQ